MTEPLAYESSDSSRLTRHDLAVVGLRLIGVYLLLRVLDLSGLLAWRSLEYRLIAPELVALSLPYAASGAAGLALVLFAHPLASRLMGTRRPEGVPVTWTANELQAVALSVVGIVLVAHAVPKIVSQFINERYSLRDRQGWDRTAELVRVGIGIYLFFGSRGIAALWRRLRGAESPPVPVHRPPDPAPLPPGMLSEKAASHVAEAGSPDRGG